jgi:hypothetical protein
MKSALGMALVAWLTIITPASLYGAQDAAQQSGASGCGDTLTVTYVGGTLNLGFTLSTATPVTWTTSVALQNVLYNLWSIPLPAVTPPVLFNVPIPGFPQSDPYSC